MQNLLVYAGLIVGVLAGLGVLLAALSVALHALHLSKAAAIVDRAQAIDSKVIAEAKSVGIQPPAGS